MLSLTKHLKKVTEDVRSLTVQTVATYLISEIFSFVAFYQITKYSMVEIIKEPTPIWVQIILVLTALLVYIRANNQSSNSPILHKYFGLLWDDKQNAHCPACGKLLSNYAYYQINDGSLHPGFMCINCNNSILRISDGNKIFMSLDEARTKIA